MSGRLSGRILLSGRPLPWGPLSPSGAQVVHQCRQALHVGTALVGAPWAVVLHVGPEFSHQVHQALDGDLDVVLAFQQVLDP